MKLFLTGGTGFIGSHFVNQAHAAGHEIVALRRSSSSTPRVPLTKEPAWLFKGLDEVSKEDLQGCEAMVHLAASGITPQPATWQSCYQANVIDTMSLVDTALEAGIRRVVVTGTYAEYGLSGLRYDKIPAGAPLEPTDPYAASKASSFIQLTTKCRVEKFELSYQRLFSVFGEGQFEKNLWPQLRIAAQEGKDFPMTHGNQIRDFISVERVADRLIEACLDPQVTPGVPQVLNLGSGNPQTLKEFAQYWWKEWNATGEIMFGAIPSRPNEIVRYVPEI